MDNTINNIELPDLTSGVSVTKAEEQGISNKGSNIAFGAGVAALALGVTAMVAPLAALGAGVVATSSVSSVVLSVTMGALSTTLSSFITKFASSSRQEEVMEAVEPCFDKLKEIQIEEFINSINDKYGMNSPVNDANDLSVLVLLEDKHLEQLGPQIHAQVLHAQNELISNSFSLEISSDFTAPENNDQAVEKITTLLEERKSILTDPSINMSKNSAFDSLDVDKGEGLEFSQSNSAFDKVLKTGAASLGVSAVSFIALANVASEPATQVLSNTVVGGLGVTAVAAIVALPISMAVDNIRDYLSMDEKMEDIQNRIDEELSNPGSSGFETLDRLSKDASGGVASAYFDAEKMRDTSIKSSSFVVADNNDSSDKPNRKLSNKDPKI